MARLTGDETIRDILDTLSKPEAYLRGVLENMADYRREFNVEPVVEIGCTGEGIYPHYRILPEATDVSLENPGIAGYLKLVTFNGRNHKPMEWTALDLRGDHWSHAPMKFDEVQNLLGELRGYKRGRSLSAPGGS